jgi:TonB family protein
VCHGEIQMPRGNRLSLAGATRDMIVMELDSAVLVKTMTAVNIQAKSHSSDCKPWQPPPPPVSGPGCAYLPVADQIELDYPPGAKEREEEGPVVLHFTLAQKSGRPGKIEVAGSSLFAELDAAAVRTLAATDMTTECPGARFSVLLNYRLDHQIAPPSPAPFNRSMTGEPCKAQLVRPVNPDDFYPKGSIERGEQGAPIVAVHVAEKAGPPLDVRLDGSSGFPELDAAGLLAIRNSRFSANCPGQWLRLKVKFVLKTPEPAPPGPSGS